MTEQPPTPVSKSGKMTRILLIISLMLNVLIIGAVAGNMIGKKRGADVPKANNIAFGPYTRALEHADRKALRNALLREQRTREYGPRAVAASFTEILDALRADPFNEDDLRAAMAAQQDILNGRQNLGMDVLVDRLIGMTDAQRTTFATNLEEALTSGRKYKPRKGDKLPKPDRD